MQILMSLFVSVALTLSAAQATPIIEPGVACKAKLAGAHDAPPIFADFTFTEEDEIARYYATKIADVEFEIQSFKNVFFYKPTIKTKKGSVTTSGYFSPARTIHLEWVMTDANGFPLTADLRCCHNCTFSDWP